jgi:hypothetical protein
MTVWTEHPKIFDPIVIPDSIDVVDLNADGVPPPLRYPTRPATIFKYTSLEQVPLNGCSSAVGENEMQGPPAGPSEEFSAIDRLGP